MNITNYISGIRSNAKRLRESIGKMYYVNGDSPLMDTLVSIADSLDYYADDIEKEHDEELAKGLKAAQECVGSTLKVLLDQKRIEG